MSYTQKCFQLLVSRLVLHVCACAQLLMEDQTCSSNAPLIPVLLFAKQQ